MGSEPEIAFPKPTFKPATLAEPKPLTAQETYEYLVDARITAFNEHTAIQKRAEVEATRRRDREATERSRNPAALNSRERLNRQLVLIRVPPPYSDLEVAIKKKRDIAKRLEVIKSAAKPPQGGHEEETVSVNKKRKSMDVWAEIRASAGPGVVGSGAKAAPPSASQRRRNLFAKTPPTDMKRVRTD